MKLAEQGGGKYLGCFGEENEFSQNVLNENILNKIHCKTTKNYMWIFDDLCMNLLIITALAILIA